MLRPRHVISIILAAALLAGCSSEGGRSSAPTRGDVTEGASSPVASKTYQWAQPATVVGENGGQIKVTPVGLLYHRGPYKGVDPPANGWFVAIALRAEAIGQQDDFVAPIGGGGFRWRGQGQTVSNGEGNASSTAWVGSVPEFGDPIEPGSPETGIETFDVPSKTGGRLLYINADQSIVSWDLPVSDTGKDPALTKVRARIKEFS